MTKTAIMVCTPPAEYSPGYTCEEYLTTFFMGVPEGVQPIIQLIHPESEAYLRDVIGRTKGNHNPIIETGKTIGEIVRNRHSYLEGTR